MKKTACCVLAIILILSLSSCGSAEYTDRVIKGADSYVTLRMSSASLSGERLDDAYFDSVGEGCGRLVSKCDKLFVCDDESSLVYALNNKIDMIMEADESFATALSTAVNMSTVTGGAYTPTTGALKELWESGSPSSDDIASALEHSSPELLSVTPDKIHITDTECKLDLDGIKEGFVAQRLMEYLSAADVRYGIVSAGDSIGVFGDKPDAGKFKIGVTSPDNGEETVAYYSIARGFISVCNTDEESVIDPADGYPADSGIVLAAVWANNGAVSDAISEAVVILGEAETFELYLDTSISFEAVLINDKNEVILTPGIAEEDFDLVDSEYTVRLINKGE